jgi:hypothetical protein
MVVKTLTSIGALVGAALIGSCAAHADPLTFPDLSAYAPANVKDYEILVPNPGRQPDPTVYFLTPDNIICKFTLDQASCSGNNLPSIPPAASNPEAGINGINWIGTTSGLNQTSGGAPSRVVNGQAIKSLPPSHSLTVNGFICGVDNSGTTACKDPQGRGFVLSPHGSGWLPHV